MTNKNHPKKKDWNRELRITGVSEKTHEEINNIAGHVGVTISQLLKPKLVDIANSYPEHYKKPMQND